MGSVFVFTRAPEDEDENQYSQGATVYASTYEEAHGVLNATLRQLRESESERDQEDQTPGYKEAPPWTAEEMTLDHPKLLTMVVHSSSARGS